MLASAPNGPTCKEYIENMIYALQSAPPTRWPRYPDDPKGCWRYVARGFGHGLGYYPKAEWEKKIGSLYGQIVVKPTFGTSAGVPINNKDFVVWIYEGVVETISKTTPSSP